jgi:hypothetical protein
VPSIPDTVRSAIRSEASDWVTPEHLNVAPQLLGAPLARPMRRFWAIAIDVVVVALLSNLGNLWLLAGVGIVAAVHLRARDGTALAPHRRWFAWLAAAVLIAIGVQQFCADPASRAHQRIHFKRALYDDDAKELAEAASAVGAVPGLTPEQRLKARIVLLEAQLAEASAPKPFDLQEQIKVWADDVGLGLGWTIAYFSLLPAWWNGQTLGKRLLKLRVVELTGKPLTVMRAFKRYGGYAAGMATGMFGFLQVFWDSNRQAIQDKTAHTVVIDLRRPPRAAPPAGDDRTLPAIDPATAQEP